MRISAVPIEYFIDHRQRLVVARGHGAFTDDDVFTYQREVWSRPDVCGYDELIDMTDVEAIATPFPTGPRIQAMAAEAAAHDDPGIDTKLAIVAPDLLAYGMGRQFQCYREMEPMSRKRVEVFRNMSEALAFLGRHV
jgi:hypothetical protein